MTLTEFLLARIAGDEEKARLATGEYGWRVSLRKRGEVWADRDAAGHDAFLVASTEHTRLNAALSERAMNDAAHIARHDPARVLAECEAKRGIVTDPGFRESGRETLSIFGERILGRMALPYADHPDYDESWRP